MVIASLIKEFQLASELNHMKGIVPDDILEALKKKKLGLPGIDTEAPEKKNAMMAGEFEVINELMEKYSKDNQGKIAKAQVKLISFENNPKPPSDKQNLHNSAPIFQVNTLQNAGQNNANFVCQMVDLGYS